MDASTLEGNVGAAADAGFDCFVVVVTFFPAIKSRIFSRETRSSWHMAQRGAFA